MAAVAEVEAAAPLSEAHAAVYDRQLRVWGLEVQKRCGWLGCHRGVRGLCAPLGKSVGGLRLGVGQEKQMKSLDGPLTCFCRLMEAKVLIVGTSGLAAEVRAVYPGAQGGAGHWLGAARADYSPSSTPLIAA